MLFTLLTILDPGSPDRYREELVRSGFRCYGVRSLSAALTAIKQWDFDAVLLDVCSNGAEMLATLRALKAFSDSPVLTLLPRDADECKCLEALDAGAHQFLIESASARLVSMQLSRLVKLMSPGLQAPKTKAQPLRLGPLTFDVRSGQAFVGGRMLRLTRGEFAVLLMLASEAGTPVHRERLAASVNASAGESRRGGVDMLVCRLRRKLVEFGGDALALETVHGRGYLLRLASDTPQALPAVQEGWTL